MHSGRGDNHAIRGVAQGGPEERCFFSDFDCERKNVKARTRFKLIEYFIKTEPDPKKTTAKQYRYFKKGKSANGYPFTVANRLVKNPGLLARKPLGVGKPTDQDVCVQKSPGQQVEPPTSCEERPRGASYRIRRYLRRF
jgi:hypothetical protein